jgi:glycosyltransferase involved in cell wall biosynthesis
MAQTSQRRPRLGVDFHVWDGIFQGSRSHLLGLYTEAIRQAEDIDFVFFLDGVDSLRAAAPAFARPHVQLVRMPHRPGPWRLALQLPWLQRRHGIELLHLQYRLPWLPAGRTVCTIHDLLFESHPQYLPPAFAALARGTARHAARRATALFAVSEFTRGEIVRRYGVAPEHITVTVNGVDRQRFHPGDAGAEAVRALGLVPGQYLLSVGRLEPRKNQASLVEAYARLPAGAPPLVFVGQRDFRHDGVFEAIRRHGLEPRVKLLERLGDAELPAVMRHAQVFAYPAFAEGFGMPVAEAMASGVPVITSNTSSLPEVAGDAALLVDPQSVDALHAALQRLLDEPALRREQALRGLRQVERFTWEASARALLARLRPLLGLGNGR